MISPTVAMVDSARCVDLADAAVPRKGSTVGTFCNEQRCLPTLPVRCRALIGCSLRS